MNSICSTVESNVQLRDNYVGHVVVLTVEKRIGW